MHSKKIKIIVLLAIVIGIFISLFMFLKKDFETLPSEGWSKELELFEIETSSEFADFFNKRLGYTMIDNRLNILYVEGDSIKFKSYSEDLSLIDEGTLMTPEYPIEKMFIATKKDEIKVILMHGKTFNLFSFSEKLEKSSIEYEFINENNNYHVSNGYLITRNGDDLSLITNEGISNLSFENRPYSVKTYINDTESGKEVFYTELEDGEPKVKYTQFNKEQELLSTLDLAPFITTEQRFALLDIQVVKDNRYATMILNIKDEKSGNTYLNFYKYDFENNVLVKSNLLEQFHDKVELITTHQMLLSSKSSEADIDIGKMYAGFNNVFIYDFETGEIRLLTKTRQDPRNYIYIDKEPYDYLVWGELHRGNLTLNISSDNPDYISSSLVLTPNRFSIIFFDTIGAIMAIPTYTLIMGVSTLVVVMLFSAPGYMIFVSFFERNAKLIFVFMIILHNIGKLIIHFEFISKIELPTFINDFSIPIIIFTNIIAVFNSRLFKPNYKFDNVLLEYIPFLLTDILLHTLIFGPYIMMQL